MGKNKFLMYFMTIVMTFIAVLSFSKPVMANGTLVIDGKEYDEKYLEGIRNQASAFEMALSEMALSFGDFFMEYLTFLLKEEVTVQKIIYNEVDALNANFFENSTNPSEAPATEFIRKAVNDWYSLLGKIVIIIYMVALIVVGIMTILGGAGDKVKAMELLKKWTIGIAIFYLFPYVMRYGFDLNEAIIHLIKKVSYVTEVSTNSVGKTELRAEDLEDRSPEYVKRSNYVLPLGSYEATIAYLEEAEEYKEKGDMMRIIRALAGLTGRFIYVILWYIMLWQLIVFIYVYYKRYLIIAFLIAIFPITLIEYIAGSISSGNQTSIASWSKEFFINVFLQSIHACIYAIVGGVIMSQITDMWQSGGLNKINWFLMICAINFVFTGEKMLKGIINAMATSVATPGEVAAGYKSGARKLGKMFKIH